MEAALFFEYVSDDVLDPDVAMQVLEQLSSTLQLADSGSKACLCHQFEAIAEKYPSDKAEFVRNLSETLGISDG